MLAIGRRQFGVSGFAAACIASLAGCGHPSNTLTAETAPQDLRASAKAYVALDVHEFRDGVLFRGRAYDTPAMFVNVAAPYNPFYARTPESMKLTAFEVNHPKQIFAIDPGTYRLHYLGIYKNPTFFAVETSPVEFTVQAGDVVYLGALEWHKVRTSPALDILNPPSFRFDFSVGNELADRQADLDRALALLPSNPHLASHAMTVRQTPVEVESHRPTLW